MKKLNKIKLTETSKLDDDSMKEIEANGFDNDSLNLTDDEIMGLGSGTLSAREQACVGKKYGDACQWIANDGSTQTGKCFYDKWDWTSGPLFCTGADIKQSK